MNARRLVLPVVVVLVGAVAAAAAPPGSRDLIARAVTVIVGAWIIRILLRRLRPVTGARPGRFDELRVPSTTTRSELPGLGAVDAALRMSMAHALGVEILLGRLLRDIARWRLHENRDIDLEAEPDRARRATGEALWHLIGPASAGTSGATRVARSALDAAIDDLERI